MQDKIISELRNNPNINFFTIILPNINYYLGNTNQEQPRNNQEVDIKVRVLELISKNRYITRKKLEQTLKIIDYINKKYHSGSTTQQTTQEIDILIEKS